LTAPVTVACEFMGEQSDAREAKSEVVLPGLWYLTLAIILMKNTLVLGLIYEFHPLILFSLLVALPLVAFFASFSLLLRTNARFVYLFTLNVTISLLLLANLWYARAFGNLLSVDVVFADNNLEGLAPSVLALFQWVDLLFIIDLPLILAWHLMVGRHLGSKPQPRLFATIGLITLVTVVFQYSTLESGKDLSDRTTYPLRFSPLGTNLLEIYQALHLRDSELSPARERAIGMWLESNEEFLAPADDYASLFGAIRGRNIITIQVESLENVIIQRTVEGQEITPNINNLLDHSRYFSNIVAQTRDGNSSDAEFLFTTSTYPLQSGSAFLLYPDNTRISLPSLLGDMGYTSIAVHGDNKEFWNRDRVFPNLGYDAYVSEEQFHDKRTVGLGVIDEALFSQTIEEIEKTPEPFNFHVITVTSHTPFKLPDELKVLNLTADDKTADYLQAIAYADHTFGDFYSDLEERGLLDDSVIVIFGDHEGIHKYSTTTWLPDNNYEVPFLIHVPGMAGFEVDKIGGQVDILPTLAFLLGVEPDDYSGKVMGRNLFGESSGSAVLPSGEPLPDADGAAHLQEGFLLADYLIRGDYFGEP